MKEPLSLGGRWSDASRPSFPRKGAADCGYDGVGVDIDEIVALGPDSPAESAEELFARYGVEPAAWGLPVNWREGDEEFRTGMSDLPAAAELAALIGCARCCTWIQASDPRTPEELHNLCVLRFREIAQVLGDFGIRLGLEWVAPRHYRTEPDKHPFIWRMDQLLDLIDDIGEPNVGMLVDSFHWFNAEHTAADIEALSSDQIVFVHINDAPDRPLDDQKDMEREVPGHGVIDIVAFVRALHTVGYDGCIDTEIFSRKLTDMPNREAALMVKEAVEMIVTQALGN